MGVAVNVTFVPAHTVVVLAAMLTTGTNVEFTETVIVFDVAVDCVTQVNDEVITTVTTSLLANAAF